MADAHASGACDGNIVGVQTSPWAPVILKITRPAVAGWTKVIEGSTPSTPTASPKLRSASTVAFLMFL